MELLFKMSLLKQILHEKLKIILGNHFVKKHLKQTSFVLIPKDGTLEQQGYHVLLTNSTKFMARGCLQEIYNMIDQVTYFCVVNFIFYFSRFA